MRAAVRALLAALTSVAVLLGAAGCAPSAPSWGGRAEVIAGGFTTGVYYDYGQQLAGVLSRELPADVTVVETDGSVDNLLRIGAGTATFGFAQSDAAADAIAGTGAFGEPLPIRAVARLYDEYVHVVVPAGSGIRSIADLKGRRISLGAANSGVTVVARRVLEAAQVPEGSVDDAALGLDASLRALKDGDVDAFFWVGGLPTPGIEQLAKEFPIRLLSIDSAVVDRINAAHDGVYRLAEFPVGAYGRDEPTVTMTVPNYLVTAADTPDELVRDVLASLFSARAEIAKKVPAAALLDRRLAIFTDPIALHPGAEEYYSGTRR
ncbi:TAXI family TRAP transporter solute-binding subunit [Microbacterium sp.]|uniref:TAXI family TRAP transporter solute-binding subunit n=1 Tax=Microbacterium sp. TaxID=51671 RepID=UPI003341940C